MNLGQPFRALFAATATTLLSSCYVGMGVGPTIPRTSEPMSRDGANTSFDIGLQYDYRRIVRVMAFGSGQAFGGALFTVGGQHVVAPQEEGVGVDVSLRRLRSNLLLRATARGYYGSGVSVGPKGGEVEQPDSHLLGGMFGATLHLATMTEDEEKDSGPGGISLTAAVLVARVDASPIGHQTFLAPMLILGFDFFPPTILKCWFIDDKCPGYLLRAKN
jgi:hypothetical protein